MPAGRPKKDPAVSRQQALIGAQAAAMSLHAMLGATYEEIARIFDVSRDTVYKRMTLAEEAGLLSLAQDLVKERLIPKALAVYETRLKQGDLDAARDVMFGTGVLLKNATLRLGVEDNSLEQWRQKYFEAETIEVKSESSDQ